MGENKITAKEYVDNADRLEIRYIPYNTKIEIILLVLQNVLDSSGGMNRSVLYRIADEAIFEAITNIDMSAVCENDLTGYDYLRFTRGYTTLLSDLGAEYETFKQILDEQLQDYYQYAMVREISSVVEKILNRGDDIDHES